MSWKIYIWILAAFYRIFLKFLSTTILQEPNNLFLSFKLQLIISTRMASKCLMCTWLLIIFLSTVLAEEGRFIFPIIKYCNYDYMKEQDLSTGWSVSRRIRVDIQVPELIKVSQFIYLDCFKSMKNYFFAGYVCENSHCFMQYTAKNANAVPNIDYF